MASMKDWALYYRSIGLSIFPVKAGTKMPLVKWGEFQKRRADEKEIEAWWTQWPDADIGAVTGSISARLVLDIDGEEGRDSVKDFLSALPSPIRTRRGLQAHFRFSGGLGTHTTTTVAGLYPGVDVRGEGGYVKLPPSLCSDGTRYEGTLQPNSDLPEPPEWLISALLKRSAPATNIVSQSTDSEHWLSDIVDGVGEGDRHAALLRLAGYYFNVFPVDVAISHLEAWNARNSPPIEEEEFQEQIEDLKKRFTKGDYERTYRDPRSIGLLSADELVTKYNKAPEYLVQGLIPQATRTIFAGWQGRGKSFAMTDLVIEISRKTGGGRWLQSIPVKPGPVIYIDNENSKNLVAYRMKRLLIPKRIGTTDLNLHFVIGNHWKMTSDVDREWLKEQCAQINPVLVVVDSLASCHALDENASKDMRIFFDDLVAPFCEEFKCGFLCIDHERKDTEGGLSGGKRLRGSSAKGDAVDTILSLNEEKGAVFLEHSKSRYSKKQAPFGIEIVDQNDGLIVKAV